MNTLLLDDRLEVRADKTFTDGSGRKLNLAKDWKDKTTFARSDNGEVNIYSYWNKSGTAAAQYISPEKFMELPVEDKALYIPCDLSGCKRWTGNIQAGRNRNIIYSGFRAVRRNTFQGCFQPANRIRCQWT